jgi:ribosomal protein S18 acetylase RimI-like enzyme
MDGAGRPQGAALRPAEAADSEVLYQIYASTREEELAPLGWDDAAKEGFLRMQFAAQDRYYHETYPDASYDLIVSGDSVLGRLYVDRGPGALSILDIALLPEHRRQGIGAALIARVLDEAETAGKPVRIYVERFNPASRLYSRLGFREIDDQGVYLLLEWRPGAIVQANTA